MTKRVTTQELSKGKSRGHKRADGGGMTIECI